jgi:hypothetical protein
MSKFYLVKSDFNWADEMDLEGFAIVTEKEKLEFEELARKVTEEIEFYVGSNEEVRFDNGEDLLDHMTFTEISAEVSNTICEAFDTPSGGEDILEMIYEYLCSLSTEPDYEQIDALVDNLEEGSANYKKLEGQARIWYQNEQDTEEDGSTMSFGFDLIERATDRLYDMLDEPETDTQEVTQVELPATDDPVVTQEPDENASLEPVE